MQSEACKFTVSFRHCLYTTWSISSCRMRQDLLAAALATLSSNIPHAMVLGLVEKMRCSTLDCIMVHHDQRFPKAQVVKT